MDSHIIFFGDSICVGQWVSIEKTWVFRIAANLGNKEPSEFVVHNRSINGNTTRQALERMQFDVLSHNPFMVVIQFGLNDAAIWADAKGYPRVSKEAYIANIKEIIERCHNYGVKEIIVNSNHPAPLNRKLLPNSDRYFEDLNTEYYLSLKNLLASFDGVHFFDIRKLIENEKEFYAPEDFLLDDGIHLNLRGHDFYYEHFDKFLFPILNKYSQSFKKRGFHEERKD